MLSISFLLILNDFDFGAIQNLKESPLHKQETRRTLFVSHSEAALSNKKGVKNLKKTSDVSFLQS